MVGDGDELRFQSTLPVGGATGKESIQVCNYPDFNPRSPWGERRQRRELFCPQGRISIHAPRGGSDMCDNGPKLHCIHFNPRSPWGERLTITLPYPPFPAFQSTLPVGGATAGTHDNAHKGQISIHAPRGGERPRYFYIFSSSAPISIHAPRGGSDHSRYQSYRYHHDFNPRSPWGERLIRFLAISTLIVFQSTLPVGGAT